MRPDKFYHEPTKVSARGNSRSSSLTSAGQAVRLLPVQGCRDSESCAKRSPPLRAPVMGNRYFSPHRYIREIPGTQEDAKGKEINTTVWFRRSQMHHQKCYFIFYSIAGEAEGETLCKNRIARRFLINLKAHLNLFQELLNFLKSRVPKQ